MVRIGPRPWGEFLGGGIRQNAFCVFYKPWRTVGNAGERGKGSGGVVWARKTPVRRVISVRRGFGGAEVCWLGPLESASKVLVILHHGSPLCRIPWVLSL